MWVTFQAFLMVGIAIALLVWSRRVGPLHSSRDGRRFQCRVSDLSDPTDASWSMGRGFVVDGGVLLYDGFSRRPRYDDPLPVIGKSPEPPKNLAVYVLGDTFVQVAIGVERNSRTDRRLAVMLEA